MRKVLAVATVAAFLCIGASGAFAQVPFMQVYFDENLTQTQATCDPLKWNTTQDLPVACVNFNTLLSTVEFGIVPPTINAAYAGDVHLNDSAWIGGPSPNGIVISWPFPKNAFVPFVAMRLKIFWICNDACLALNEPIIVIPSPSSGFLEGTRYPDLSLFPVVGMTSLICPQGVSTEESTWGKVKSLYQN